MRLFSAAAAVRLLARALHLEGKCHDQQQQKNHGEEDRDDLVLLLQIGIGAGTDVAGNLDVLLTTS